MQLRLQLEKKTVPDPFVPLIQGSSNIWRDASAIFNLLSHLHLPFWPFNLLILQLCGQSVHEFNILINPFLSILIAKGKKVLHLID